MKQKSHFGNQYGILHDKGCSISLGVVFDRITEEQIISSKRNRFDIIKTYTTILRRRKNDLNTEFSNRHYDGVIGIRVLNVYK